MTMDVWSTGRGVGEASEGVGVRGEVGQAGGLGSLDATR